jgi:hypothetical protein
LRWVPAWFANQPKRPVVFSGVPEKCCLNCGFLVRWDIVRQQLVEVNQTDRANDLFTYSESTDHPGRPKCYQDAFPLKDEITARVDELLAADRKTPKPADRAIHEILRNERSHCRAYTVWNPALSLKEQFAIWREDAIHGEDVGVAKTSIWAAVILGVAGIIATGLFSTQCQPEYPNQNAVQQVVVVTPTPTPTSDTATSQPTGGR